MRDFVGRLERLESRAGKRSGLTSERRKHLTDRAVLQGDQEALAELDLYRPERLDVSCAQRDAALAVGLRIMAEEENLAVPL